MVEGLNYMITLTIRKACGYRTLEVAKRPFIMHVWTYPSRNTPTNSAEDAFFFGPDPKRR